jgi:hypothetical protein
MAGWHYVQRGTIQDTTVGPLSDADMEAAIFAKRVTAQTQVAHPQVTRGQWVAASTVRAIKQRIDLLHAREEAEKERKRQEELARTRPILERYARDGQSPERVVKIFDHVSQILTSSEELLYLAHQQAPHILLPDGFAATSRRFIVLKTSVLGQPSLSSDPWLELHEPRLTEGMLWSSLSMRTTQDVTLKFDCIPKPQARALYRISQEQDDQRKLSHARQELAKDHSALDPSTVAQIAPQPAPPAADDPLARLQKLKALLDAGLITSEEYEAKKGKILEGM